MSTASTTGAGRQNELTEINAWEETVIGAGKKPIKEKQPSAKPGVPDVQNTTARIQSYSEYELCVFISN